MGHTGQITSYIDVAQLVLYAFWAFFAALIFYLHREGKREGYPLQHERPGEGTTEGIPAMPTPKTYLLADGTTRSFPNNQLDTRPLGGVSPRQRYGEPLVPVGDPMLAAIGPGAYAQRADSPDMTHHGEARIVPMRVATSFSVASQDADTRGMVVVGADRQIAGKVTDIWVDLAEFVARYLEVELASGKHVLLPLGFVLINRKTRQVNVNAILGGQFANVPSLRSPDQVTLLEEDKIVAYYGGGLLYATPQRAEAII